MTNKEKEIWELTNYTLDVIRNLSRGVALHLEPPSVMQSMALGELRGYVLEIQNKLQGK